MFFKNFFKEYDLEKISNVYYISGEDKFLKKRCVDIIVNQIKKNKTNPEFYKFDDKNINLSNILNLCQSIPLVTDFKCIILKDLELDKMGKKEQEILTEIISDMPEYCCIIFLNFNIAINKSKIKNIINTIKNTGKIVEIKKPNIIQISDFITLELKNNSFKISNKNAKKIAEYSNYDLNRIFQEINKLVAYCQEREDKEILEKDIELLVIPSLEVKVFDVLKLINNKNKLGALKILNELLANKEEPTMILSIIAMNFIDIYRAKVAKKDGKLAQELVDIFDYKGKEFRINKAFEQSNKYDLKTIKNIINLLVEVDYKLKTSTINKKIILEKLIIQIIDML